MAASLDFRLVIVTIFGVFVGCHGQDNDTTVAITTPSSTIPSTPSTTPPPTQPSTLIERNTDLAECTCDLTQNACDVNCCCDPDCSSDDRLAFSFCADQYTPADSQACVRSEIVFRENTPFTINTTAPGLFCVVYDNYEERNYYDLPEEIDTPASFEEYENKYGKYSFKQESARSNIKAEFYKSGDPILTVYESLALGYLAQPAPLTSSSCKDSNPAAYLSSRSESCLREIDSLGAQCMSSPWLNAETFYTGFKVVSNPELFLPQFPNNTNTTDTMTTPTSVTPSDLPDDNLYNNTYLLEVYPRGPHTCIDSFGISFTCNFTDELPSPTYEENPEIPGVFYCYNTVVQVTYHMDYNGTNGIMSVGVTFTFQDIGDVNLPLKQTFATQFDQLGQEDTFQRSGNPGYVVSQPILAGRQVTDVDSSGNTIYSIELNSDRNNWMTVVKPVSLASNRRPTCVNNTGDREPITFGVNMRSGCFVRFFFDNMTELCNLTQWAAWDALRGPLPPSYIASFGNSDVETFGDWVPILGWDQQPATSNPGSEPGTCLKVLTGLHIQIVYANVGALDNPQPKIIGARYQYSYQNQLKFQCIGPYCQPGNEKLQQSFEVVSSVQFIDASEPAKGVSGEIPRVTARLPDDFFYPFS